MPSAGRAGDADLETGTSAEMPVVPDAAILTTRSHDQAATERQIAPTLGRTP